jgi:hypothetical protein
MSLLRVIALKQPLARAGSGTERPLRSTEATCSFQNFDRFSCEWGGMLVDEIDVRASQPSRFLQDPDR